MYHSFPDEDVYIKRLHESRGYEKQSGTTPHASILKRKVKKPAGMKSLRESTDSYQVGNSLYCRLPKSDGEKKACAYRTQMKEPSCRSAALWDTQVGLLMNEGRKWILNLCIFDID